MTAVVFVWIPFLPFSYFGYNLCIPLKHKKYTDFANEVKQSFMIFRKTYDSLFIWLTELNYSTYFALSEYVLSLVSIFILSPVFTNNGTIILAPVSTSAGLSELVEEVSPFIPGSV